MKNKNPLELIKRIKSLADTGLVYSQNDYDKERYEELLAISLQLLSTVSEKPLEALSNFYLPEEDYPTPKIDIRALVLNKENKILMAKEQNDGKWSIPGGWGDIGYSPSEVVVKEVKEETGLDVKVLKLLAVFDKKCHPHPPEPLYVYKLVFLCEKNGGDLKRGFDIEDVDYFDIDDLPALSENRVLKSQIEQLYQLAQEKSHEVYFD